MKIGDKVSFLSETGGGVIAGFQGKNIVLVEDEDGFQIPTPINEVVVIGNDDYSIAKVVAKTESKPKDNKSVKALLADGTDSDVDTDVEDVDIADKEVTFKMPAEERKGGNALSCYLAFVPINIKEMTTTRFEAYLVNDCNYTLQYSFMTAEGNAWTLHSQGEIEPNTSLYIEEVGREELNSLLKMGFQLFAYKRDKSFILKPVVEVQLRLDPVKFYKLHSFQKTIYFDTPALLYTIVEDDKIAHPLHIDAAELKNNMAGNVEPSRLVSGKDTATKSQSAPRPRNNDELVVDLHIDALLDSTAGMSHADILNYQIGKFQEVLDKYSTQKGKKIIFIHGKGEGVLRHSLINMLNYKYKRYQYQDASFQEYGYGATQVTIR